MRAAEDADLAAMSREIVSHVRQQARDAGIEFYFQDTVTGWQVTRDPPLPPEDSVVRSEVARCLDDCVTATECWMFGLAGLLPTLFDAWIGVKLLKRVRTAIWGCTKL